MKSANSNDKVVGYTWNGWPVFEGYPYNHPAYSKWMAADHIGASCIHATSAVYMQDIFKGISLTNNVEYNLLKTLASTHEWKAMAMINSRREKVIEQVICNPHFPYHNEVRIFCASPAGYIATDNDDMHMFDQQGNFMDTVPAEYLEISEMLVRINLRNYTKRH